MFKTIKIKIILIIFLFISSLLLSGCIGENNSNDDNDVDIIIKEGDFVEVKYVARFTNNRTMYDTSDEEIAKQYNIYNPSKNYGNLKIFINPNNTIKKPSGFDNYLSKPTPNIADEIIGMKKNEIKNFTYIFEEVSNLWDVELAEYYGISPYPIDSVIKTNWVMDETNFNTFFPNVTINMDTNFDWGKSMFGKSDIIIAEITNIIKNDTGNHIEYVLDPENGTNFTLPLYNWTVTIIVENETHFKTHTNAEIGYIVILFSESGDLNLKVVDKNETSLKIGINLESLDLDRLNQQLTFVVEIMDIIRF